MTQWYLYENDEVIGPFTASDLSGRIEKDTLVCPAGEKEWREAEEIPELESLLSTGEPQPADADQSEEPDEDLEIIEPTLENFIEICEQAADQTLLDEFADHFQEYDNREQTILREEIERRGLETET